MIAFSIPIIPTAQARARHAARKLKSGKVISTTYKSEKQEANEHPIYAYLKAYVPVEPLQGALKLGVKAYLPIPKKSKRWMAEAEAGIERPTTKPDMDNLIKQIKDCMTKMRFWHDDKQVVEYLPGTGKWYSTFPRWEIMVLEVPKIVVRT